MARGPRHIYRHSSPETLVALFASAGVPDVRFDPDLTPAARAIAGDKAFLMQSPAVRAKLQTAFSDINALASDLGEDCIRQIAGPRRAAINERFPQLLSSHDRVVWVRETHPDIFQAALAVWFFERRSMSNRLADAFASPDLFKITTGDLTGLGARIAAIIAADVGEAPRVKIELHELQDGAILIAVSHEELWTTDTEFTVAGDLDARAHRVVHHAAAKIESGMLTIAAERGGAQRRVALCHAIAEEVLGLSGMLGRLPPLTYNLQRLLDPAPFSTDPAHMITDVLVTGLTVSAPSLGNALIGIYTSGRTADDVRARMLHSLSASDRAFASVQAAEVRVIFGPGRARPRPRVVRLSFSGPTTCKVQLDSAEESLLRTRYLKAWGLIAPQRGADAPAR